MWQGGRVMLLILYINDSGRASFQRNHKVEISSVPASCRKHGSPENALITFLKSYNIELLNDLKHG